MKKFITSEAFIFVIIGLVSLVVIVAGLAFSSKTAKVEFSKTGDAKVEFLNETSFDWGEIDIYGGNATYTFEFKNTGTAPLELANVKTSCACTEARVTINGTKSPFFGMHTRSTWTGSLAPQETAEVYVVFDPLFHGPGGTGAAYRLVSIDTNSKETPRIELKLTGVVISEVQDDQAN
jgi:hypothetical protein